MTSAAVQERRRPRSAAFDVQFRLKSDRLLAAQQRPHLVVLSGDITQRARPAQFRAAKAFVDRLGAPVLAVPGNHDIALLDVWSRLTRPYARYAAVFGTELEPVHNTADLLVIGVNTTRAWRHKHGEVSSAQIDRVAGLLGAARPGQLRLVVVHQPVGVTLASERINLLRGHRAAIQAWVAAGADLVMGRHIHLPFTLALPGLARPLWAVQAGTAASTRTRPGAPNSVDVLRWGQACADGLNQAGVEAQAPGCCLIERWDFAHRDRAFVRMAVTPVYPERS